MLLKKLLTFLKKKYDIDLEEMSLYFIKNKHHWMFIFTTYISTYCDLFIFKINKSIFLDM